MKLVASLIVRDELGRYLKPCIQSLLEFCDEIRVLDDGSTDGHVGALAGAFGEAGSRVIEMRHEVTARKQHPDFYLHAAARNRLLSWTLEGEPDYVLAIDADEFVADGQAVRRACETDAQVVTLEMAEVWEACEDLLCIRQDGGWRAHEIGCVWRAEAFAKQALSLADHGHATGRVPDSVHRGKAFRSGTSVLHFGWTNREERAIRYERYAVGDAGKFHAAAHIRSIMWPPEKITLEGRQWPAGLPRKALLERANRTKI